MEQIVLILALASLLLVGCGGNSGGSAPNTATTPEQLHSAWVEAIKANNRDALLALAADMEFKTNLVDDNLRPLQERLRAAKDGQLQSVDVRSPTDEGAGKIGVSVWKFEKHTACYRTVLSAVNGVWKVSSWGVMYACPAGVK
jgi:hypothetical protein